MCLMRRHLPSGNNRLVELFSSGLFSSMVPIYSILKTPFVTLRQMCGLLLLLLSTTMLAKASGPVITPLSYTAYHGETDVPFNCFAPNITWVVNNRSAVQLQDRGIVTTINRTLFESNLTIPTTLENNNTHIECLSSSDGSLHFNVSRAVFYVQGVPEKCHDLQIILVGRYQHLKWDPPFTLNITAVEPDIFSYSVCSNISNECITINVTEAGGDSQGLRQYTFPKLRAYINFTVKAVNIVGDGESASIVTEPCEHTVEAPESFAAQNLSAVVTFDSENVPCLSIETRSHRECFDVYKVRLESQEREQLRHFQPEVIESGQIIPDVSFDGILTLNVTTNSTLNTNVVYRATLITTMDMMEVGSIQFSTYDVQDVEVHGGSENISIQCVFASGSQARGFHVEIRNSSTEKITSFSMNITRSGSPLSHTAEQTVTGLTPGSYEVLIFDWERDGSVSSTPSYVGHVNVTALDTSTTSAPPTTTTTPPTQLIVIVAVCGSVTFTLCFVSLVVAAMLVPYCNKRRKKVSDIHSTSMELSGTSVYTSRRNISYIPSATNTSSSPSGNFEDNSAE